MSKNNLFKSTLSGIRTMGLEPSTRSKMMRIAKDYTLGRKQKTTMIAAVAATILVGLSYGLYSGLSDAPKSENRRVLSQERRADTQTVKTDFKVPQWLGGNGQPSKLGKSSPLKSYAGSKKTYKKQKASRHSSTRVAKHGKFKASKKHFVSKQKSYKAKKFSHKVSKKDKRLARK